MQAGFRTQATVRELRRARGDRTPQPPCGTRRGDPYILCTVLAVLPPPNHEISPEILADVKNTKWHQLSFDPSNHCKDKTTASSSEKPHEVTLDLGLSQPTAGSGPGVGNAKGMPSCSSHDITFQSHSIKIAYKTKKIILITRDVQTSPYIMAYPQCERAISKRCRFDIDVVYFRLTCRFRLKCGPEIDMQATFDVESTWFRCRFTFHSHWVSCTEYGRPRPRHSKWFHSQLVSPAREGSALPTTS